jgi:hypothetical protein
MINKIIIALTILCLEPVWGLAGKGIDNFRNDFSNALDKSFTAKALDKMLSEYAVLLIPHGDITQFSSNLQGHFIFQYPLSEFKQEKLYVDNIDKLINSENPNHRILAYLVLSSSGDNSHEGILLDKIKKGIVLEALANSPTQEDRNYLLELANKQSPISEEVSFKASKKNGVVQMRHPI